MAKPFCKYVGGKGKLAERISHLLLDGKDKIPTSIYYQEPFLGGGAVFFYLQEHGLIDSQQAILSDTNEDLILTYQVVRDQPTDLIEELRTYKFDKEEYYARRAQEEFIPVLRAARFIYLNKCCFNGLYRVNKAGKFNVPFGRYDNPTICDVKTILDCSMALTGAAIMHKHFNDTESFMSVDGRAPIFPTVVYCDPPYVPLTKTASFTSYQKEGFGPKEQSLLASSVKHMVTHGHRVVLSNHDTREVRNLYAGLTIESVRVPRAINSSGSKRGMVGEVLISGGSVPG